MSGSENRSGLEPASDREERGLESEAGREPASGDGERELRLGELVLRAAALDAGEREAFLRRAADDDPELLAEVRRRLRQAEGMPSSFLSAPAGRVAETLAAEASGDEPSAAEPLPEKIGPYRVVGRLGVGGMGEVYEGYDDRLDRPVALKRVRPESDQPEKARARFQREARAVARLSHSAIVQVYDWAETDDGDWIVMERVEGRSLKQILAGGPLAPDLAVRLARDVAAGLAAAHEAGVVHRDLKANNVMVTATAPGRANAGRANAGRANAGRAKILDFGIAKRLERDAEPSLATLTTEGKILGTVTAMSPEQALGHRVDHRSDLFSLGTLLYEMVTGASPFDGRNPMETLTRICSLQQQPARERNPAVPAALSALIDRLLEKEPEQRPQSAGEVAEALAGWLAAPAPEAAAEPVSSAEPEELGTGPRPTVARRRPLSLAAAALLVLVLGGIGVRQLFWRGAPEPIYVAVPETVIGSTSGDDGARNLLAGAVHASVLRAILSFRGVAALEPTAEDADLEPAALARALGADEVLASRLECAENACRVFLKRVRGGDGSVRWAHDFTAGSDALLEVGVTVSEQLRGGYRDLELRREVPDLAVRPEDYETYLRLWRRYKEGEKGTSLDDLLAELEGLQRTSPGFLDAYILESTIARVRFQESRRPEDWERSSKAIERARDLAPTDPRVLGLRGYILLDGGRLEEAEQALDAAERLEPGGATLMHVRSLLLKRQGRHEEARQLLREAVKRQPSWRQYFQLSELDYRAGEIEAARSHLQAGLARSPNNFLIQSRMAQLELLNGSAQRAAELYETLVDRVPGDAELTNLGLAYLLLKRYGEAVRCYRRVLESNPTSPYALFNLADAELLRGGEEAAASLYQKVLEQIAGDPNPDQLLTVQAQALAHLGRFEEAVAAIQRSLRLEPDNPHATYEAALVYALAGDDASALWNARQALEKGVDPRWFSFAWFDHLRPRLEGGEKAGGAEPLRR